MNKRLTGLMTLALAALLVFAIAGAQDTSEKVQEVIDKNIEASGGKEAFDAIENVYLEGTFNIPAMGLSMNMQGWVVSNEKMLTVIGSDAVGEMRRGWNGEVFWETSMMTGPRIVEGAELTQAIREMAFDKYVNWREYYESAEYVGEDTINGVMCHLVKFIPAEGNPTTVYISKESGLAVAEQSLQEHQMGEIPVTNLYSDYREVGGVLQPFKTELKMMGQNQSIVMSKMETNVEMPDSLFVVPAEIEELLTADETQ